MGANNNWVLVYRFYLKLFSYLFGWLAEVPKRTGRWRRGRGGRWRSGCSTTTTTTNSPPTSGYHLPGRFLREFRSKLSLLEPRTEGAISTFLASSLLPLPWRSIHRVPYRLLVAPPHSLRLWRCSCFRPSAPFQSFLHSSSAINYFFLVSAGRQQ